MQIFIELFAQNQGITYESESAWRKEEKKELNLLFKVLKANHYVYDVTPCDYRYDKEKKELIPKSEDPTKSFPLDSAAADALIVSQAKSFVIDTERKTLVAQSRYDLCCLFSDQERRRPISVRTMNSCFTLLGVIPPKEFLNNLYRRQFELYFGKNAQARACIENGGTAWPKSYHFPPQYGERKRCSWATYKLSNGDLIDRPVLPGTDSLEECLYADVGKRVQKHQEVIAQSILAHYKLDQGETLVERTLTDGEKVRYAEGKGKYIDVLDTAIREFILKEEVPNPLEEEYKTAQKKKRTRKDVVGCYYDVRKGKLSFQAFSLGDRNRVRELLPGAEYSFTLLSGKGIDYIYFRSDGSDNFLLVRTSDIVKGEFADLLLEDRAFAEYLVSVLF